MKCVVQTILKAAGLSGSAFYYQHKVLQLDVKYSDVKEQIRAVYAQHKGRYGYLAQGAVDQTLAEPSMPVIVFYA